MVHIIKEHITKILLSGIFGILGVFLGSMYHDLPQTYLQTILEPIPKQLLLKLLLAATIIIFFLVALSFFFYTKSKTKLTPKFGVFWDKNKEAYCPSCEKLLSEYSEHHSPAICEFRCIKCSTSIRLMNMGNFISLSEAQELLK